MEYNNLQYNYIICGCGGYYDIGYRDVMHLSNVNYYHTYDEGVNSRLVKKLIRFNFSQKVNKYIKTPFARIVYPHIYKPTFTDNKPLCFVFFGNVEFVYQTSYISYLRAKYPNVKIVLYMQDLIDKNPNLNFNNCKDSFDLILSYDKGDCIKYNLHFHPTPMSYVCIEKDAFLPESDIYFCGYAKTRYPIIHRLYQIYSDLGFNCDFHIMKFPENEPKIEGIHYEEYNFTYEQNIQHVMNTKAVLEIMQEGADGFTPRVWESIIYDKHLLTNNLTLMSSDYYNPEYMHDCQNIDSCFIINKPVSYSAIEKSVLSPTHLLMFIDNLISKI